MGPSTFRITTSPSLHHPDALKSPSREHNMIPDAASRNTSFFFSLPIPLNLQAQMLHDFLGILPHLPFCRRISQKIGRVESGHHGYIHVGKPLTPFFRHMEISPREFLC